MQKNEIYDIEITGMGSDGEGIGRADNFVIFVPNALIGEKLKIQILKVNKTFAYGKVNEIIESSSERITPDCPVYYGCGGCSLRHMTYLEELRFKEQKVKDALRRIGGILIQIEPIIGSDNPAHYRNKAQFPVGQSHEGEAVIGFYAKKSHDIIDIKSCNIQHPATDKIISIVKEYIKKYKIPIYDEAKKMGILRHVYVRIAESTGEIMVTLVTNGRELPEFDELITMLKNSGEKITGILQNINNSHSNVIMGRETIILWGKDKITDYIGDIKFQISPLSFYQVNHKQTEKLYSKVLEFAGLTGKEIVFDLYCGIGTISLFLAKNALKVFGVEIESQAVTDAIANAKANNAQNVEFITGTAEEAVANLYMEGIRADVVVIDPPRSGCDESLLDSIVKINPQRIVYVSCDASTLARDLKFLTANEYDVTKIQPIDMFPRTSHVECVVLLTNVTL